jgi:hypothetical protein
LEAAYLRNQRASKNRLSIEKHIYTLKTLSQVFWKNESGRKERHFKILKIIHRKEMDFNFKLKIVFKGKNIHLVLILKYSHSCTRFNDT